MSQNEWYCRIDGDVIGPMTARGIRTMAAVGELIPTDEVRNGLDGNWEVARVVQGLQFASSVRKSKPIPPQVPFSRGEKSFVYRMVQLPRTIEVHEKEHRSDSAAVYLENLVNEHAREGWEFYRVDTIGVKVKPGCLGAILALLTGQQPPVVLYYVVTFRRLAE